MEAMLQRVTGCELLSMMDEFLGYNQVKVKESKKYKTTFTTPWGTYIYVRISFGLTNVGSTFQRAMYVSFFDLINVIMVVYQDDLTSYSKKVEDHVAHLEKIFLKALECGISLNPKKCHFAVKKGKLLGNIVSKEGVRIDAERVEAIDKIPIPKAVKVIQFFFGLINFVRRFISNYAEIVKPISKMLKKGAKSDWTTEAIDMFCRTKILDLHKHNKQTHS